jgi:predicted transcriptional regulator
MRLLLFLALIAGCTGNHNKQSHDMTNTSSDAQVARLKQALAEARKQSESYLSGEALPARKDIAAIVDAEARPWWEPLSPEEAFLLFEASPGTAARAPAEVRASAYCAGVAAVSAEWWGTPGYPQTEVSQRLIAQGAAGARCLAPLFEDQRRITYKDGETRLEAKQNEWTVADLAAGLAARALGEAYDAAAAPADRAAARAALRPKLQ